MSVLIDALETFANFMPVAFFSVLGFWKPNAVLFMLAGGASMMAGLYWDIGETGLRVSIGVIFIMYAFLCLAYAYRMLFWQGTPGADE